MTLASVALASSRLALLGARSLEAIGRLGTRGRGTDGRVDGDTRRRRAGELQRINADLCRNHGFRVEVEGRWHETPALYVANHLSYIDPVVIGSILPCAILAKAEVERWPFVGAGARALGVIFVDRADPWSGARALRACKRSLVAGVSVLNFPEGTTSDGTHVLPFRRGIFWLARRLDLPVVPITLSFDTPEMAWVGDALFLPHYLKTASRRETVARLRMGAPLLPRRFFDDVELGHAAREAIAEALPRQR